MSSSELHTFVLCVSVEGQQFYTGQDLKMHPSVLLLLMAPEVKSQAFNEASRPSLGHSSVLRVQKAGDLVYDFYEPNGYSNLTETTIASH